MDDKVIEFEELQFEKLVKDWLNQYDEDDEDEDYVSYDEFLEEKTFDTDFTKDEIKLFFKHVKTTILIYGDAPEEEFRCYEREQMELLKNIHHSLKNNLPLKLSINDFKLSFDSFNIGASIFKETTISDYYKNVIMLEQLGLKPTLTEKEFTESLIAFQKILIKCRVIYRNTFRTILPPYL